jgi:hypothetical protein
VPETRLAPYTSNGDQTGKSMSAQVGEVWELIVAYAKQETVEPLKGLPRFVGLGVAGSFALAIGIVLLLLAVLRLLQTETGSALQGHLSWIPYLATLAVAGLVAYVSAKQIQKHRKG